MTIQYASDLHLEQKENLDYLTANPLRPVADVLILAGDILPLSQIDQYNHFISYLSDNWNLVLWIPGNHEYYGSDISQYGSFKKYIKPNVIICNRVVHMINNIPIICATLWSHIFNGLEHSIKNNITDFNNIFNSANRLSIRDMNAIHEQELNFITSSLMFYHNLRVPTIIVTHHVPTLKNYPPRFVDSSLNSAFATENEDLILKYTPSYWVYGHHHQNVDSFKVGDTYLLTNQLGYIKGNEQQKFQHSKTFEM